MNLKRKVDFFLYFAKSNMEDKKVIVKTKLKTPLYKGDPTFANGSITICWTFHCDMGKKLR